ncbi:hypothetical protein BASA81_013720 [Batrachochytrium salamandrivorans]|nr:hypothetical protein BASA81_013720 [Batrachochytrium salamandrivorans]
MLQPSPSQQGYLKSTRTMSIPTSASGLEARSYQPELNSRKDSATLMLLKRRDNSGSGSITSTRIASVKLLQSTLQPL